MIVKRIGAMSLAKVSGIIYAFLGFIVGIFMAFIFSLGALAGSRFSGLSDGPGPLFSLFFGFGSIIIFPILYGLLGFLAALIAAALYNWIVGFVGGIELDLE